MKLRKCRFGSGEALLLLSERVYPTQPWQLENTTIMTRFQVKPTGPAHADRGDKPWSRRDRPCVPKLQDPASRVAPNLKLTVEALSRASPPA
jgi:hypothetical protein